MVIPGLLLLNVLRTVNLGVELTLKGVTLDLHVHDSKHSCEYQHNGYQPDDALPNVTFLLAVLDVVEVDLVGEVT